MASGRRPACHAPCRTRGPGGDHASSAARDEAVSAPAPTGPGAAPPAHQATRRGWFGPLFGLHGTYRIASPLPVLFFAVLFGLSMDYEVFPGLPDPRGLPGHRRQRRVLPHLTLDSQDE